jgi:uncharacterized protein YndB with AHSA1/START domain
MENPEAIAPERFVITRIFDAPRELVWKAWTDPKYVTQWWGPKGFSSPFCEIDFRIGGRFRYCMKTPEGQEFWTGGEYQEIVPLEKIVYSMFFADADGNKVQSEHYGIEHKADENAFDSITFEDIGNGQTKITYCGNETMEDAASSGQLEGMNQTFDKIAAVLASLAQAK